MCGSLLDISTVGLALYITNCLRLLRSLIHLTSCVFVIKYTNKQTESKYTQHQLVDLFHRAWMIIQENTYHDEGSRERKYFLSTKRKLNQTPDNVHVNRLLFFLFSSQYNLANNAQKTQYQIIVQSSHLLRFYMITFYMITLELTAYIPYLLWQSLLDFSCSFQLQDFPAPW